MSDQDTGDGAAPDESEWRFPLSDFEDNGDGDPAADSDDAAGDGPDVVVDPAGEGDDASASGVTDRQETIEAGEPTLEGVFFLLLGVAFTLFVISRLVVG